MTELRSLPKVDVLADDPLLSGYPQKVRSFAARQAVAQLREQALAGQPIEPGRAAQIAAECARSYSEQTLRTAINLSGVILHTGLGRARLAPSVAEHVAAVAASHAIVELDPESGERGDRQGHVRSLLTDLTGAEDALVVNNAAAGVFLALNALCLGREVVLSRGQMVEIGGSFRMPDIVRQSGCTLVEVGCTNKTRLTDYSEVIGPDTAAILRCHPSNFKIIGFTEEPSTGQLASIAREHGKILIDDQGSGCIVDTTRFGLPKQETITASVQDGADISICSGDKMLGGPQAGIVVGRRELIQILKKHPLARAVRVDKLTVAALEATLRLYQQGREMEIPVLRYLGRELDSVKRDALQLAKGYPGAVVEHGLTEVGGGSAPGTGVATWRVGLPTDRPQELARRLRTGEPAILPRIEKDLVWLDPRTLEKEELKTVLAALRRLASLDRA